jgi:hypothetical protein
MKLIIKNYFNKFIEITKTFLISLLAILVYFFIIAPIGISLKILRKDILNIKFSSEKSYWIDRKKNIGSMKKQF